MIAAVGQHGSARVASGLHDVVILNASDRLPGVWESGRKEVIGDSADIDAGVLPERRRLLADAWVYVLRREPGTHTYFISPFVKRPVSRTRGVAVADGAGIIRPRAE
jgi:hypothetical protein